MPELVAKQARQASQPSSSHMFTTAGHWPVEPTTPQTPKQSWFRSSCAIGLQFAVMWCM